MEPTRIIFEKNPVSFRGVFVGLICVILICSIEAYNDYYVNNTWLAAHHFPIVAVFLIGRWMHESSVREMKEFKEEEEAEKKRKIKYLKERKKIAEEKENEIKETEERHRRNQEEAYTYFQKGGLTNLKKALKIYNYYEGYDARIREIKIEIGKEKERLLDFKGALTDFEELELYEDAKRIRQKMQDEGKVDQTVVHGDYIDDRDTIVKDSVISKSNIGGGSSKMQELEKLTETVDWKRIIGHVRNVL